MIHDFLNEFDKNEWTSLLLKDLMHNDYEKMSLEDYMGYLPKIEKWVPLYRAAVCAARRSWINYNQLRELMKKQGDKEIRHFCKIAERDVDWMYNPGDVLIVMLAIIRGFTCIEDPVLKEWKEKQKKDQEKK